MSGYTNEGDGAIAQLTMMVRLVLRQTLWRAVAHSIERRARRLPDSWLIERLTEAEDESLSEMLAVLRSMRLMP